MSVDPYAERTPPAALEGPAGEPPWAEDVRSRGGILAETAADALEALDRPLNPPPRDAPLPFVAVLVRDHGPVPPFAQLTAPQAGAWLLAASNLGFDLRGGDSPQLVEEAGAEVPVLLDALAAAGPLFLVKHGTVAGPPGEPGAREVDAPLVGKLLDAALDDRIEWERDPDFGWEVPARVPGIEGERADALLPRLLYARHGRAYEHADLVPELKRQLHKRLSGIDGLAPAILATTGWPPKPTSDSWKR